MARQTDKKSGHGGIQAQKIDLPKGGGAIKGLGETFSPDAFSGTGSYAIPLAITSARGFEPNLTLSYQSGGGNGPFGLGFSLPLAKISRLTERGIPRYDGSDVFVYGGDELVLTSPASSNPLIYQPRVEEDFSKIEFFAAQVDQGSYWRVTTGSNTTHIFGQTAHARVVDPNDPKKVFDWLIEHSTDAHGNRIEYSYKAEDSQGIEGLSWERERALSNTYIQSIQYGNYPESAGTGYAFEVIFDYGEYDLTNLDKSGTDPHKPSRPWALRPDAFSSYRSGFEIRTRRRCENVLLFHNFETELGALSLVKAWALTYADNNPAGLSLLKSVTLTGYRRQGGNAKDKYDLRSMPPAAFTFSGFRPPTAPAFKSLTLTGYDGVASDLPGVGVQPVDFEGEGIAGLLATTADTIWYMAPQGGGSYSRPQTPPTFPIDRNLDGGRVSFRDLDGNGRLDLTITDPARTGFYPRRDNGSWGGFTAFADLPNDYDAPYMESVDLSANGKTDALVVERDDLLLYESRGRAGFAGAVKRPKPDSFPVQKAADRKELVTFGDLFGDGLSHRIKVANGRVEAWPDLGYGQFGEKITLGEAPVFDETFDIARLHLADIDGSGTLDLIYVYPDKVALFINRSGNRFIAAGTVKLPETCTDLDHIDFADILGNGTTCLTFTKLGPQPRHYFYSFVGETALDGDVQQVLKPYLLNEIDNGIGAVTRIEYASSTKFYLADRKAGRPWITKLRFPVQVVEKTITIDAISKARLVRKFAYHDGFYDTVEREFRGFGYVETWDTETFSEYEHVGSGDEPYTPPTYTRSWYHTGVFDHESEALAFYKSEFFNGDPEASKFPASKLPVASAEVNPETVRQANVALKGHVIRNEVYGQDGSTAAGNPYTVEESNYEVRLLQAVDKEKPYAVFMVLPRESISYDYERNPDDPRVTQNFALKVNDYGQVLKTCTVNHGRRSVPTGLDPQTAAQQKKTWIACDEHSYFNSPDRPAADFYVLGVDQESRSHEITAGLTPTAAHGYFTFADIAEHIDDAAKTLLHWERDYYYDAANSKELLFGKVTAQALHHRTTFIEFDKEKLKIDFTEARSAKELATLLTSDGGYINTDIPVGDPDFEEAKNYYWNPGSAQSYDAANFYQPNAYFDPFQYPFINFSASAADREKAARITYGYDTYGLLITKTVDPLGNKSAITKVDYRTLHAAKTQDINLNKSSVVVDPLGMVVATSECGTQIGETVAFACLSAYRQVSDPSVEDIVKNPSAYLQGAASFFYYDLSSWKDRGVPVHAVSLNYDDYTVLDGKAVFPLPSVQISISYSDGLGRDLQSKTYLDSAETVRSWDAEAQLVVIAKQKSCWLASGAVGYDNKGQPVKQYEPYFAPDYTYVDEAALNRVGYAETLHYDALGRHVRTVTPEGFIEETRFGSLVNKHFMASAWSSLHYDANDTVLWSKYELTDTADVDRDAWEKTKAFADTPIAHAEDSLGRVVESRQLNAPEKKQKNANFATFDIIGNELTSSDQRLHAKDKNNFVSSYNLSQQAVKTVSADAGTRWMLADVVGHHLYGRDSRKFTLTHTYDVLRRPLQTHLHGGDGPTPLDTIVNRTVYGDSKDSQGKPLFTNPEALNLRGQVVIGLDEAGLSLVPSFAVHGQALIGAQWLKKDYKNEADWSGVTGDALHSLAGEIKGIDHAGKFEDLTLPPPLVALLEPEVFVTTTAYDAIGREIASIDADGNTHTPAYYSTNWLKGLTLTAGKFGDNAPSLSAITYNAKGQRTKVTYGNGVKTTYTYDPMNFRLTGIRSTKRVGVLLQDLSYHHDPVGNVTSVINSGVLPVFFKNRQVDATADYTYDSLYRLTKASGREHAGMQKNVQTNQNKFNETFFASLGAQLSDGQALQTFTQGFDYDDGGNLTRISHSGSAGTRTTVIQDGSNRIKTSSFGAQSPAPRYAYDANGNMTTLDGRTGVAWNYRDNMQSVTLVKRTKYTSDAEYYVYDSAGRRVRKIHEQQTAGGGTTIHEVIYLGGIEIRRRTTRPEGVQIPKVVEWHMVRVMDGDACACVWRSWVSGKLKPGAKKNQLRYQLTDSLNSSLYELDEDADTITYEEYYPYGGTSIFAAKNQTEAKTKHYHYSGKEKDNSTGLSYYGMRYYAPWLGRWTSADPAGTVDGLNLYAFVGG
ncbi:MAG: SpvB/TcaC N-terminal domain-containing protein, partial [Nisaea sp.]